MRQSRAERETFICDNIGLVGATVARFKDRGYDREELFQVGCIGLVKAADRFDASRGLAFSTYAVPMIFGEIRRFLRDDGILHISRGTKERASKIAAVRERMVKETGREPTIAELECETGFSKEEIVETLEFYPLVESIHRPIGAQEDIGALQSATIMDRIKDERCHENEVVDRVALEQVTAELGDTEKQLLFLRYMDGRSQSETGVVLGMNQVAISRMEKKILLQLRKKMDDLSK
jgi:RNA polymerase sporulation-specific sigma factor